MFEEFSRKYFSEALKDLKRAEKALTERDYPEAVFHAQQCVEKAIKSMIEAKREYVCNHGPRLISEFIRVFEREWQNEFSELVDSASWLAEYYTRSRYPFVLRGRVISPDEFIDENIAREAIEKARRVVSIVEKYLRQRGII